MTHHDFGHAPLLALVVDDQDEVAIPAGFEGFVGRDPAAGLVIGDPRVSWRHAELVAVKDCLWIRDLTLAGGLRWNGEPVEGWASLLPGDVVHFGAVRASVRIVPENRVAERPDQGVVLALFVFAVGLAFLLLGSVIG